MNILIIAPVETKDYEVRSLLQDILKGKVKVNLDRYFPYREDLRAYPELGLTKGKLHSHTVIITSPDKRFGIRGLKTVAMDLVIRGTLEVKEA